VHLHLAVCRLDRGQVIVEPSLNAERPVVRRRVLEDGSTVRLNVTPQVAHLGLIVLVNVHAEGIEAFLPLLAVEGSLDHHFDVLVRPVVLVRDLSNSFVGVCHPSDGSCSGLGLLGAVQIAVGLIMFGDCLNDILDLVKRSERQIADVLLKELAELYLLELYLLVLLYDELRLPLSLLLHPFDFFLQFGDGPPVLLGQGLLGMLQHLVLFLELLSVHRLVLHELLHVRRLHGFESRLGPASKGVLLQRLSVFFFEIFFWGLLVVVFLLALVLGLSIFKRISDDLCVIHG